MAFIAVIPNRLELGFIMATRGTKMMIEEIDSSTFALITFIIRGKSAKMKVSQNLLEESRKRPGLRSANEIQAIFLLFTKRFLIPQADHPLLVGAVVDWNLSSDLLLFIEEIHMNNTVTIICSKMQNLKQIFQ